MLSRLICTMYILYTVLALWTKIITNRIIFYNLLTMIIRYILIGVFAGPQKQYSHLLRRRKACCRVAGGGRVLVLDVPVHAAHRAKLFAADAADGLTSVELLVVVPGTCRGGLRLQQLL